MPNTARCPSPWSSAKGRRLKWLPRKSRNSRLPPTWAPFFRRYELPWSPAEEMERRFPRHPAQPRSSCSRSRGAHAVPAAPRASGEYRFLARARGAAGDGAAAAAAATAAAEAGEAGGEGAGGSEARAGQPVDPRVKASKSGCWRIWMTSRRCATSTSTNCQESAEDHRSRRRERGAALAHHLQGGRHQRRHQRAHQQRLGRGFGLVERHYTAQVKDPTLASGRRARPAPAAAARPRAAPRKSHWCSPRTRVPSMPCMRAPCATIRHCRARW
jgi:hypothetical protein